MFVVLLTGAGARQFKFIDHNYTTPLQKLRCWKAAINEMLAYNFEFISQASLLTICYCICTNYGNKHVISKYIYYIHSYSEITYTTITKHCLSSFSFLRCTDVVVAGSQPAPLVFRERLPQFQNYTCPSAVVEINQNVSWRSRIIRVEMGADSWNE